MASGSIAASTPGVDIVTSTIRQPAARAVCEGVVDVRAPEDRQDALAAELLDRIDAGRGYASFVSQRLMSASVA